MSIARELADFAHMAGEMMGWNRIINGSFDIWQRGTSFSTHGAYTADRWHTNHGDGGDSAATTSRQDFTLGQTDVPGEPRYYIRHDRTIASSIESAPLRQRIEGVRTLAGRQVTVSFYAKAGASKALVADFRQSFGTGGSPSSDVDVDTQAVNLTTAWQRFELTFELPSISGKTLGSNGDDRLEFRIREASGFGTFTLDLARVQIEEGYTATKFDERPIALERALCERYFEKSTHKVRVADPTQSGQGHRMLFSVPKRAAPTLSVTAVQGTVLTSEANGKGLYIEYDTFSSRVGEANWEADAEL